MAQVLMESHYKIYKSICGVYETTCRYGTLSDDFFAGFWKWIFKSNLDVFATNVTLVDLPYLWEVNWSAQRGSPILNFSGSAYSNDDVTHMALQVGPGITIIHYIIL